MPARLLRRFGLIPGRPGVRVFAFIASFEAVVRGVSLSIYPLLMYRAWNDAATVSKIYFVVGLGSLLTALSVPLLARRLPRRWLYSSGVGLYLLSALFGMVGGKFTALALASNAVATATAFVCFNAYVLDNVPKADFSRLETLRLLYGGVGWTAGPILGVWLLKVWHGAPFIVVGLAAALMLVTFWTLQLGDGRSIATARTTSAVPFAYLLRFFTKPRLVAGWLFAVLRSCGWWIFIVYVGIFAVQSGLGEQAGGVATSLANAGLFGAPLMLRWMLRRSVRHAVRVGFLGAGLCFLLAAALSALPWLTLAALIFGAYFLVLLDICGGLPFMMSVKPSERADMAAVYSSFRDVSAILSPGLAWLVLQFSPVQGLFAAGGLALLTAWYVAGRLHPDLGVPGAKRARQGRTPPIDRI